MGRHVWLYASVILLKGLEHLGGLASGWGTIPVGSGEMTLVMISEKQRQFKAY